MVLAVYETNAGTRSAKARPAAHAGSAGPAYTGCAGATRVQRAVRRADAGFSPSVRHGERVRTSCMAWREERRSRQCSLRIRVDEPGQGTTRRSLCQNGASGCAGWPSKVPQASIAEASKELRQSTAPPSALRPAGSHRRRRQQASSPRSPGECCGS